MEQRTDSKEDAVSVKLAKELRQLRKALGFTLREVETSTGISNAYLSQLETGKIVKPSPNILYKLAEFYNASYETLMELAGYIVKRQPTESAPRTLAGAALASTDDLTAEEESLLMDYLAFLRSRRRG